MNDAEQLQASGKVNHVGAPACWALELACQHLNTAFAPGHCYLVGSALERPDRRDIDIRLMLDDADFDQLFPQALDQGRWEGDSRWLIMCAAISQWLNGLSGLPVDFQFQRRTDANKRHSGRRDALGMVFVREPSP